MSRFLLDTGIASDFVNRRYGVFERARAEVTAGRSGGCSRTWRMIRGEIFFAELPDYRIDTSGCWNHFARGTRYPCVHSGRGGNLPASRSLRHSESDLRTMPVISNS